MNNQSEFQVVVLAAGKGSRMPELTTNKPKCLLPIGGRPMVWYPLQKLQQSGFAEVILVVCDKDKTEIHAALDKTDLNIKVDYFTIQSSDEWGTAESLRALSEKIKHDLIIVSCDLITNVDLATVLHEFRRNDASLASLYFTPNTQQEMVVVPGPKSKYKPERDLVGVDAQTNRLVFLASTSDFETDVAIPLNTFKKHPNVKMFSNLLDSHFYVMRNWLLKYLSDRNKFSTFKGEFLPHALKQQFKQRTCRIVKGNVSEAKSVRTEDIFDYHGKSALEEKIAEANGYNDHVGDTMMAYHEDDIRCYAIITKPDVLGVRVNTLQAYWALNGKIATEWDNLFDNKLPLVQIDPKADIKSNQLDKCFVWDSAILSEKTSFRNSILGTSTNVEKFSRVINSVVMNNVQIHEKVVIENCIICDDVVINTNCTLKGCIIGSRQNVPSDSEHNNEVLTDTEIF